MDWFVRSWHLFGFLGFVGFGLFIFFFAFNFIDQNSKHIFWFGIFGSLISMDGDFFFFFLDMAGEVGPRIKPKSGMAGLGPWASRGPDRTGLGVKKPL